MVAQPDKIVTQIKQVMRPQPPPEVIERVKYIERPPEVLEKVIYVQRPPAAPQVVEKTVQELLPQQTKVVEEVVYVDAPKPAPVYRDKFVEVRGQPLYTDEHGHVRSASPRKVNTAELQGQILKTDVRVLSSPGKGHAVITNTAGVQDQRVFMHEHAGSPGGQVIVQGDHFHHTGQILDHSPGFAASVGGGLGGQVIMNEQGEVVNAWNA